MRLSAISELPEQLGMLLDSNALCERVGHWGATAIWDAQTRLFQTTPAWPSKNRGEAPVESSVAL